MHILEENASWQFVTIMPSNDFGVNFEVLTVRLYAKRLGYHDDTAINSSTCHSISHIHQKWSNIYINTGLNKQSILEETTNAGI